jgi:quercetin dioxygenase-like cupin family protein
MNNPKDHAVKKPWGREYLAYHNEEVAIWVLEIMKDAATSLHCHPSKNTALIVLRGEVELSLIRGAPKRFTSLDKINIFRGRFHRTRAVSDGVVLLEVEAPDDKHDLVRLEDDYFRLGIPIEEATEPKDENCLQIVEHIPQQFAGCSFYTLNVSSSRQLFEHREDVIFVTLRGGLDHGLLPPGDAIDGASLERFAKAFSPLPHTTFLQIWKSK